MDELENQIPAQDCELVYWLQQAENYAEVQIPADDLRGIIARAYSAVNALPELLERVRRLEEALKFYADPNRWPNMPNPKNPHYDLEMDAGSRARFALHARAALNQEPGQKEQTHESD